MLNPPPSDDIDTNSFAYKQWFYMLWTSVSTTVVSAANSFIQLGAGAVTRTLQDKARDIVSVKDFGAVGDGVSDDTIPIQAAINAGAQWVYFPKGSYKTSAALTIKSSYVGIIGQGRSTRILPSFNGDVFTLGDNTNPIVGLAFKDFVVWPSVVLTLGYVFNCRFIQASTWSNVYVGGIDDYVLNGHRLNDGYYFDRFTQCVVMGGEIVVSGSAIKARGNSDQSFGAELLFDGSLRIYRAGAKALWLGGAAGGVYLERVDISECRYGVYCDDTLQAGITNRELFISDGCTIDNCTGTGIKINTNGLAILEAEDAWVSGCGSATFPAEAAISVDAGSSVSANWGAIRLQSSYYDGASIGSGIHSFSGGYIRNNGLGANGGHGLILTLATVSGLNFNGVTVHNNGNATRGYGLENSVSADYTNVGNNTFFSNGQGAMQGLFVSNNRISSDTNSGYSQPWLGFTPTITATAGAFTTVSGAGRYRKIGRLVYMQVTITVTTVGTASVTVVSTLPPFTPAANYVIAGRENAATGKMLQAIIPLSGATMSITNYDNTFPGGSGNTLHLSGFYESTT